ncbi:hypothetical protein N7493_007365 [Penicillium malachiteum]|uniref:Apple domain-containing protein n=1 Tax=Penicillium malachiteum TaxID=1324776 RepID=A0AAD6MUR6_9EURO|nr:hypothetical protein N7493_007365 [Penicillium malachiteum]
MKVPLVKLSLLLLGAMQAEASCVAGHREQISSGYWVEYKCDVFKDGDIYYDIESTKECAKLGQADKLVCTYNDASKGCIVSKEGGKEGGSKGSIYLMPVEESEIEPEDPFAKPCSGKLSDCQSALAKHKPAEIECPANNKRVAEVKGRKYVLECGTDTWLGSADKIGTQETFADCISVCAGMPDCYFISWSKTSKSCWVGKKNILYGENKYSKNMMSAHHIL